jgi:hypothetical protein
VESNFVLEAVLQQKEMPSIEALLLFAEIGYISLRIPAFSLNEPFSTLMRIGSERRRWSKSAKLKMILDQLKQSERSGVHRNSAETLDATAKQVVEFTDMEKDLLHDVIDRILQVGKVLPTDHKCYQNAFAFQEHYVLQAQDSIILATILADAQAESLDTQKCFLSSNSKDFNKTRIIEELKKTNCRYISSFNHGLAYIQHQLQATLPVEQVEETIPSQIVE